jgi:hypothetical protein
VFRAQFNVCALFSNMSNIGAPVESLVRISECVPGRNTNRVGGGWGIQTGWVTAVQERLGEARHAALFFLVLFVSSYLPLATYSC